MFEVAFIADRFASAEGGTERQLVRLVNSLAAFDIQPRVIFLDSPGDFAKLVKGVSVESLGITSIASWASLKTAARVVRELRQSGVRVCHIFFNDSSILFPPLLKAAGIRVIISRRDLGFWYTPALKLTLRAVGLLFVDRVVVNCQAVQDVVVREEWIPRRRIQVVYNALSNDFKAIGKSQARSQLGIDHALPVATVVANLRPLKRIDVAIRALGILRRRGRPAMLLVAGADVADPVSRMQELRAVAAAEGVQDQVQFLGAVADPTAAICAADVCLLLSSTEGFSNSIMEYLALERPVICTGVGGNPELVRDGETGYIVPVGDAEAVAERLQSLMDAPQLAARFARNGRDWLLREFTLERSLTAHAQLYRDLAGEVLPQGQHQ